MLAKIIGLSQDGKTVCEIDISKQLLTSFNETALQIGAPVLCLDLFPGPGEKWKEWAEKGVDTIRERREWNLLIWKNLVDVYGAPLDPERDRIPTIQSGRIFRLLEIRIKVLRAIEVNDNVRWGIYSIPDKAPIGRMPTPHASIMDGSNKDILAGRSGSCQGQRDARTHTEQPYVVHSGIRPGGNPSDGIGVKK